MNKNTDTRSDTDTRKHNNNKNNDIQFGIYNV